MARRTSGTPSLHGALSAPISTAASVRAVAQEYVRLRRAQRRPAAGLLRWRGRGRRAVSCRRAAAIAAEAAAT
eukprot:7094087-Lingulodinium_polyedra.AAC.1